MFEALVLAAATAAGAAELSATVKDVKGAAVEGAVVYVVELKGRFEPPKEPYVMDQVDLELTPHLLPVLAGGKVRFPNRDGVHHHLYSFSEAKKFELPLYKDKPAEPIVFETTGVAKLGCNIHDWMAGVVVVLQNPHFATTGKDGKAVLKDVPAAAGLEAAVFHPRLKDSADDVKKPVAWKDGKASLDWSVKLRRDVKKKRPSTNPYGGD